MSLVLASRSAARARMLADAGVEAELRPVDVDEEAGKAAALKEGLVPEAIAARLADAKALACVAAPSELVIGGDQALDLDGELFDKPVSLDDARGQLLRLRGRTHRQHAAVTLVRAGEVVWRGRASAALRMRDFSPAFLERYLQMEGEAVLAWVGAYRLEGLGAQLFTHVEGDYFTVLGLPLLPLLQALRDLGELPG